jgi:hypothetical protein
MNEVEIKLYVMIIFHLSIWLFVMLAWAFKLQKYALYFLPFIFLFQCLPFHGIVKKKLEFVKKNKDKLKRLETYSISKRDKCKFQYYAKKLNMKYEDVTELFSYLRYYELSIFILKYKNDIYNYFEENGFENPVSSQGMIIIPYILNTLIK